MPENLGPGKVRPLQDIYKVSSDEVTLPVVMERKPTHWLSVAHGTISIRVFTWSSPRSEGHRSSRIKVRYAFCVTQLKCNFEATFLFLLIRPLWAKNGQICPFALIRDNLKASTAAYIKVHGRPEYRMLVGSLYVDIPEKPKFTMPRSTDFVRSGKKSILGSSY